MTIIYYYSVIVLSTYYYIIVASSGGVSRPLTTQRKKSATPNQLDSTMEAKAVMAAVQAENNSINSAVKQNMVCDT